MWMTPLITQQAIASVFNEYFLSVAEKMFPQDDNNTISNNNGTRGIKDKHRITINSDPSQ
jgi:hypothetical protein